MLESVVTAGFLDQIDRARDVDPPAGDLDLPALARYAHRSRRVGRCHLPSAERAHAETEAVENALGLFIGNAHPEQPLDRRRVDVQHARKREPAKAGTDDGDARTGRRRGWMKFVVHGALRWLRHAVDPQWFAASSDRGRWKRWPTQRECMGGVSAVVRSCNCYRPDSRFSRWLRLHYRTTR